MAADKKVSISLRVWPQHLEKIDAAVQRMNAAGSEVRPATSRTSFMVEASLEAATESDERIAHLTEAGSSDVSL